VKLEHNRPHVMLWVNMIADQVTGLFLGWIFLTPYLMQKCGMTAVNACSTTLQKSLSQ